MTRKSHITTGRNPHEARHQVMVLGLVGLGVYPVVTLPGYLTEGFEVPTFVRTFLTTILTVPLITYLVVPRAKRLISTADPKA